MSSGAQSRRQFDVEQKCAAVRRVLGGENPNRVAAEIQVSRDRLKRWERHFLEGGRQGIARGHARGSWFNMPWRQLAPWGGLVLLLIVGLYGAWRFLQAP
jgi:hypothetical protein